MKINLIGAKQTNEIQGGVIMTKKSWVLLSLLLTVVLMAPPLLALPAVVNINSADVETLATQLKGIGSAKAAAIVEYREKFGPFKEVEDIVLVKGIGWKMMEANRELIRLRDDDAELAGEGSADAANRDTGKGDNTSVTSADRMKSDPS
jgi:competence protein ComEA